MIDVHLARLVIGAGISNRIFPAAVVEVGTAAESVWRDALGHLSFEANSPATTTDTVFDLASLTKVLATATVAMRLFDTGLLELDAPVSRWIPEWRRLDRAGVTVQDLLEHCSGLKGWEPLYTRCAGRSEFISAICEAPLEYQPRTAAVYSDLGFMLLGWLLERAGDQTLDQLFQQAISHVPGLGDQPNLRYCPPTAWLGRTAPTRLEDWRGRLLVGEVDDANAWALGGVAGHAGLFGTAAAVGCGARSLLALMRDGDSYRPALARAATLRRFLRRSTIPGSSRALAWDTMRATSSCGTRMSADAFGHTGFTGTSLWIDPAAGLYVVLLTNRVHPEAREVEAIQSVRRGLHDAVFGDR